MAIEYIRYGVAVEQVGDFETACKRASVALDASPHCLGDDRAVCANDRTQYVLPMVEQILEIRHYTPTAVPRRGSAAPLAS